MQHDPFEFGDRGMLERVTTWWQEVNHDGKAMVEFHDGDTGLVDLLHERYCLSGARWAGGRTVCGTTWGCAL